MKDKNIIKLASTAISIGITILFIISIYNPSNVFNLLLVLIGIGGFVLLNLFVYLFISGLIKLNKNE